MNEKDKIYSRENTHSESNNVEVYFCDSGFTPLFHSDLKKNTFYSFEEDFSIGNIKNINIDINIDSSKNIRIWSSHSDIHEYLSFLYFCHQFHGQNISVVFVDDYSKYVFSIGTTIHHEIPEILKYEHKLTYEEIEKYKKEWLRLVEKNSELRLFKNKKVISVSYDYLNDYILKHYDKDNLYKSISNLMAADNENHFSSSIYKFLIERIKNK